MLKKVQNLFSQNKLGVLVIILGSVSWILTMIKSGLKYDYGYGFWGANGYDGVWHIALINNLSKLDFTNPVFAPEVLKNYHVGFDLLLGVINQITKIPVNNLYFQIFPIVASLILGILTYVFVLNWISKKAAILATLFTYIGGSGAWVIGAGESTFWSQQAISTLINPPYALSLIFVMSGLIAMQRKKLWLSILFFGVLIQIKAYAAILVLGGLFVAGVYQLIKSRQLLVIKIFAGSLIVNLIILSFVKSDNLSVFSWYPFWFLETLFAAGDRLSWPKMAEAMLSYKNQSVVVKFALAYGFSLFVFTLGNYWTRLIFLKDVFKKLDLIKVMFLVMSLAGFMAPLFLVQVGTPWNTIQFMYYSLFFTGILTAISISNLKNSVIAGILLLTLPTTLISLKGAYVTNIPPSIVPSEEIEALQFLKNQPGRGIVLTYPFDLAVNVVGVPNHIPLYKYSNTSYVPAFSEKNIYFERTNLEIMGYDWEERRKNISDFFLTTNISKAKAFLDTNNIEYLYLVKEMTPLFGELLKVDTAKLGLERIFENKVSIIYKYGENFGSN